jgi:hypothetical protein
MYTSAFAGSRPAHRACPECVSQIALGDFGTVAIEWIQTHPQGVVPVMTPVSVDQRVSADDHQHKQQDDDADAAPHADYLRIDENPDSCHAP